VTAVPLFLAGLPVVAYALVDPHRGPRGGAAEFMRGERFVPAALAICRDAEGGFYLFGCDAEWNTVTDTWHESVEDAQHQAEFEHAGVSETWQWC
jgi:hypothetical protein